MPRNCLAVLSHSSIFYKIQHRSAPIEHPPSWYFVIRIGERTRIAVR
jgi:hypothetical protein